MTDVKRLLDEATPLPWVDHFCQGTDGGDECWQGDPHHDLYHPDPNGDGTFGDGGADILCVDRDCPEVALILHAVNALPDYEAAVDAAVEALGAEPDDIPGLDYLIVNVDRQAMADFRSAIVRLRGATEETA